MELPLALQADMPAEARALARASRIANSEEKKLQADGWFDKRSAKVEVAGISTLTTNMSVILCTAGYDHTIRFWEALSGICSRTIQHPESQVNRLCITPDKKYLAAAGRHVVRMYDIKSSNPNVIMTFEGHTNNITGVAFHCEGKWMVTSSEDCSVRVWDTRNGAVQRSYTHDHPVNDVVIHPNQGELVSCDRYGMIMIWDLGDNKCTHQLVPEDDVPMATVSIASDGSLLAAGNSKGDVYLWRMFQNENSTTLSPCRVFSAHKTYLNRLLLSPDIKLLATCSADHTVRIWKIDMNEDSLEVLPEPETTPLASGTDEQDPASINLSNLTITEAEPSTEQQQPAQGQAQAQTQQTQTRSRSSSNLTGTSSDPSRPSTGVSANNTTPLDTFRPVNAVIATRKPLPLETTLESHQRWVWDCAFSADSAYLVTVCSDHYARLWEVASATIIRQYNGHHRGAVCVALNDYSSPP